LNFITLIDVSDLYYNRRIFPLVTWIIAGYLSVESNIRSVEKFIASLTSVITAVDTLVQFD